MITSRKRNQKGVSKNDVNRNNIGIVNHGHSESNIDNEAHDYIYIDDINRNTNIQTTQQLNTDQYENIQQPNQNTLIYQQHNDHDENANQGYSSFQKESPYEDQGQRPYENQGQSPFENQVQSPYENQSQSPYENPQSAINGEDHLYCNKVPFGIVNEDGVKNQDGIKNQDHYENVHQAKPNVDVQASLYEPLDEVIREAEHDLVNTDYAAFDQSPPDNPYEGLQSSTRDTESQGVT